MEGVMVRCRYGCGECGCERESVREKEREGGGER